MILQPQTLAACCGCDIMTAQNWVQPIGRSCDAFDITTPQRLAAFLAQIAHESGRLRYVREIWGPTPAQTRYEGRRDLGNVHPGDGYRYRGRGLIQTTGRANYAATTLGLRKVAPDAPDFELKPEALEAPRWAALSAAWFWASKGLNELADVGDFMRITRRINGGTNGYEERLALWERAKAALGVTA